MESATAPHSLSNQEIFDRVQAHLLTQLQLSLSKEGGCNYRGVEGTKCAVGCLIPDHLYSPTIERISVDMIMMGVEYGRFLKSILNQSGISNESFPLLKELQLTHDYAHADRHGEALALYWEKCLRKVAKKFGLKYNPFQ